MLYHRRCVSVQASNGFMALQTDISTVLVESLAGDMAQPATVSGNLLISSLDITKGAMLLHDGTK